MQATRWTHVRQAQSSRARRTCAPLSRVRRMPRHIRPQIIYSTADSRGRRSGQLRAQPRVLLRFAACCKARVAKQNSKSLRELYVSFVCVNVFWSMRLFGMEFCLSYKLCNIGACAVSDFYRAAQPHKPTGAYVGRRFGGTPPSRSLETCPVCSAAENLGSTGLPLCRQKLHPDQGLAY